MEKLELYLDQVCRSLGGPRAMRDHVRQELREHLLDAIAQHKAAGLSDDAAIDKALAEFGQPEEVRTELEASYGQRKIMAMVIDRALDWKEKTMRAKWLWVSWAYLAVGAVILLNVLWITFADMMIVPKYHLFLREGILDPGTLQDPSSAWMGTFLNYLDWVGQHWVTPLILIIAVLWGLFEWRVRSDNKSFMRLSALGTAAVLLTLVSVITAGTLVLLFCIGVPAMQTMAQPYVLYQVNRIDVSVGTLEKLLEKKDGKALDADAWKAIDEQAGTAYNATLSLLKSPAALPSLVKSHEAKKLREQTEEAFSHIMETFDAIRVKDAPRLEQSLRSFRKAYEPIREVARKPTR